MALAITATPDLTTVPPSVKITLSGATGPTTLTRQDADGTMATVRTADGQAVPSGTTSVVDYEAPFRQQVTYFGNGTATSNPVTLFVDTPWLVHPGRPDRSVPLTIMSMAPRTRAAQRGVFTPIGRTNPIVVSSGARSSSIGSVTALTETSVERRALEALLEDGQTLLLNLPADGGWGMKASYVSVGDVEIAFLVQGTPWPQRVWTLPYLVVDAPLGGYSTDVGSGGGTGGGTGGTGTRTWADLALEAATWADAAALYATWGDAATGNHIG